MVVLGVVLGLLGVAVVSHVQHVWTSSTRPRCVCSKTKGPWGLEIRVASRDAAALAAGSRAARIQTSPEV